MPEEPRSKSPSKLSLSLDYRLIAMALLAVIVALLLIWRPWQNTKSTDRTVEVTGQASLSARPDEFVFSPMYEFKSADKQGALDQLTLKNNEIIAKLKSLGVADKDIKANSDSWSYPVFMDDTDATPTYSLRFTVTVGSDKLAQTVQDYLVTTAPSGSISPQATFSDQKRKELEDKARDQATKDARQKAEQSAKNLGFKLAAVKAVNDGAGFGYPVPYATTTDDLKIQANERPAALSIQPGENDLTYTVTVTYFIR